MGIHKGSLEAQIYMWSYMCVGLVGGGKRRDMKEAGGGAGQAATGPGNRGSAGQDGEARSPLPGMEAHSGLPPCASAGQLSCSASWSLGAFFRPCTCTFVQQTCVEKLSYILSLHGPGHRDRVGCSGSYYKILLEKKARCRVVGTGCIP